MSSNFMGLTIMTNFRTEYLVHVVTQFRCEAIAKVKKKQKNLHSQLAVNLRYKIFIADQFDDFVQGCGISDALAMDVSQSWDNLPGWVSRPTEKIDNHYFLYMIFAHLHNFIRSRQFC